MEVFQLDASPLLELASGQVHRGEKMDKKKQKVNGVSVEKEAHLRRLRAMLVFKALTLNATSMRGDMRYESYEI